MAINATNYDGTKDYKIAEIGDVYHPNLLINGDFNINQRAESSYTGGYSLDMWLLSYNVGTVTVGNGYITVAGNQGTSAAAEFTQKVESLDMTNKKYTLCVKLHGDNTIHTATSNLGQTLMHQIGDGEINMVMWKDSKLVGVTVQHGKTAEIEYIALYEGETAYSHVKESYALAMTRCLPWIEAGDYVAYKEGHTYIMGFNYRYKKMSTPTITFGRGVNEGGFISGTFTAVSQNIDSCPFIRHDGSVVNGQITLPTIISCEPF